MAIPSTAELLKLDVPTRLRLIDDLWDSIAIDPAAASQLPPSGAQRALLDERLTQHASDPSAARPWTEIREEILKKR